MHATCMFKCYMSILAVLKGFEIEFFYYFEMLSFESYFAWICSCCMDFCIFSFERYFEN